MIGDRRSGAATPPERNGPGQPPGTSYRWLPIDDRILDILAAHDGPAGICPSITRLGKLLDVSGRYVRKRLEAMEAAHLVQRTPVFEKNDDPEWQSRGHRSSHPGRQTSSTYRLLQFRGPPGTPTNLVGNADAQVNPPELAVTDSSVSSALEEKEPADGGYQGGRDEDECSPAALEPIEIAVEPPEEMLLDHDPTRQQLAATLAAAFGDVEVLGVVGNDDPDRDAKLRALHTNGTPPAKPKWSNRRPSYRPAGKDTRRLPLTGDLEDFHAAIDALDDDTVHWNYFRNLPDHRRPAR